MAYTSENPFSDAAFLKARIEDAVRQSERRGTVSYLGFFTEEQRAVAEGILRHTPVVTHAFWGGFAEAERTLLGVGEDSAETDWFPLTALEIVSRGREVLGHRQVLGSLLSLGVRRETVGDILCADTRAVVFVRDEVLPFVQENLTRVGGAAVTLQAPFTGDLPAAHTFREHRDTVASARLDAVTKICVAFSREEAARLIAAGLVSLNHRPALSASAAVREGDLLSIRGHGRFLVDTLGPPTKKGRLFITLKEYI